jgi:hypothetical protein
MPHMLTTTRSRAESASLSASSGLSHQRRRSDGPCAWGRAAHSARSGALKTRHWTPSPCRSRPFSPTHHTRHGGKPLVPAPRREAMRRESAAVKRARRRACTRLSPRALARLGRTPERHEKRPRTSKPREVRSAQQLSTSRARRRRRRPNFPMRAPRRRSRAVPGNAGRSAGHRT